MDAVTLAVVFALAQAGPAPTTRTWDRPLCASSFFAFSLIGTVARGSRLRPRARISMSTRL
jgi:hypothetical protein